MRKVKILLISLAVAGVMAGCGKEADNTEVNATEVQSTVEEMSSTAVSEVEVASETAPTEIATEPVAQTASPEDEVYNYGMLCGLGLDQDDAKIAAAYMSGISYGRITSTERIELNGNTYIELKNNEAVVLYLYIASGYRITEITDFNLHTLITISEDSDSNSTAQPSATQNNGTTNGAASNNQPAQNGNQGNPTQIPVDNLDLGNGWYHGEDEEWMVGPDMTASLYYD